MWEKVLGVHEGHYLHRVIARIPIACLLWFLALLIPFFGPLNSLIGAFIMSFSVYIIPCIAYLIVFKTPKSREVLSQHFKLWMQNILIHVIPFLKKMLQFVQDAIEKPWKWMTYWNFMVPFNVLVVCVLFTLGFGFGGWSSVHTLIKQLKTFGLFDKCYQCSL